MQSTLMFSCVQGQNAMNGGGLCSGTFLLVVVEEAVFLALVVYSGSSSSYYYIATVCTIICVSQSGVSIVCSSDNCSYSPPPD